MPTSHNYQQPIEIKLRLKADATTSLLPPKPGEEWPRKQGFFYQDSCCALWSCRKTSGWLGVALTNYWASSVFGVIIWKLKPWNLSIPFFHSHPRRSKCLRRQESQTFGNHPCSALCQFLWKSSWMYISWTCRMEMIIVCRETVKQLVTKASTWTHSAPTAHSLTHKVFIVLLDLTCWQSTCSSWKFCQFQCRPINIGLFAQLQAARAHQPPACLVEVSSLCRQKGLQKSHRHHLRPRHWSLQVLWKLLSSLVNIHQSVSPGHPTSSCRPLAWDPVVFLHLLSFGDMSLGIHQALAMSLMNYSTVSEPVADWHMTQSCSHPDSAETKELV